MSASRASWSSSSFVLPASTPPYVSPRPSCAAAPDCSARGSDGPYSSLGSQWSPFFSATCFTEAHAARWARSSLSYCSCALSSVFS